MQITTLDRYPLSRQNDSCKDTCFTEAMSFGSWYRTQIPLTPSALVFDGYTRKPARIAPLSHSKTESTQSGAGVKLEFFAQCNANCATERICLITAIAGRSATVAKRHTAISVKEILNIYGYFQSIYQSAFFLYLK